MTWSCEDDNGLVEHVPEVGDIKYGSGSFVFDGYEPLQDKPINVYYYNPGDASELPIMIYMHGNGRNAQGYRDGMAQHAYDHNFLLIVPEFTAADFNSREYHRGGVVDAENQPIDESRWTFSMIEPLFDFVKEEVGSQEEEYALYGFSAGGQFVHRYMFHKPENRAHIAIAASAGYYTMPDWDIDYAYGLNQTVVDQQMVDQMMQNNMFIIVGGEDTGRDDDVLQNPLADAQGWNRVERGRTFFNRSKNMAQKGGISFNWDFAIVPGEGHSHRGVAGMAAEIAFGALPERPSSVETFEVRLDRPGYNASPNMMDVNNIKRHSRNGGINVQSDIDFGLWNSSSSHFNLIVPSNDERLEAFGSGRTIRDEWEVRNEGVLFKLPPDAGNQTFFNDLTSEGEIVASFESGASILEELELDPDVYGPGGHLQEVVAGELIFFHSLDRNTYMVALVESIDNQSTGYADLQVKRVVEED